MAPQGALDSYELDHRNACASDTRLVNRPRSPRLRNHLRDSRGRLRNLDYEARADVARPCNAERTAARSSLRVNGLLKWLNSPLWMPRWICSSSE